MTATSTVQSMQKDSFVVRVSAKFLAFIVVASMTAAAPRAARSQTPSSQTSATERTPAPTSATNSRVAVTTATAALAKSPPLIDGSDSDAAWALAAPITDFRTFQPVDDGEPRFTTSSRA